MHPLARIVDYLADKRVALVGGDTDSVEPADLWPFDAVFWTNNHWTKMPKARISGLFHCCGPRCPASELVEYVALAGIKLFVGAGWATEAGRFREYCSRLSIPALFYGDDPSLSWLYQEAQQRCFDLGSNEPFTGYLAARFLHFMPVKEVHLFGMNLYNKQDWTPGMESHNPVAHAQMFRELFRADCRFKPCVGLIEALTGKLEPASGSFSPHKTRPEPL